MSYRLHLACDRGNLEEARRLLAEGEELDRKDDDGETPLLAACCRPNSAGLVAFLVGAGADVNAVNRFGIRPLHRVCILGCADIAQILVAAGADVHAVSKSRGRTPLHSVKTVALVRLLLKAGADPYAPDLDGDRPIDTNKYTRHLVNRIQSLVALLARARIPTDLIREFALYV